MKKKIAELLALLLALPLCACQSSMSLGERAIVKAIYLDSAQDGMTRAALVVFTCSASADAASAQGEAKIYSAEGRGVEDAIRQAERMQNKKPFYGQNELLLIGPNAAVTDVTPLLAYFAQEDAGRANLGVFVTPLTAQALAQCEPVIAKVIGEGERLLDAGLGEGRPARGICEIELADGGVRGWLPVLRFSSEAGTFTGVRSLLLFEGGRAYGALQESELQLALVLAGKQNRLTLREPLAGRMLSCETGRLAVEKTTRLEQGAPHLTVTLRGEVRQISADGIALHGAQAQQAARQLEDRLTEQMRLLHSETFCRQNDVFRWGWWLRMCDARAAIQREASGELFDSDCVEFSCVLSAAR